MGNAPSATCAEFLKAFASRGNGGAATSQQWITEGMSEHRDFIMRDLGSWNGEGGAALWSQQEQLLQELLDLNPETHRIPMLLQLCCGGLDHMMSHCDLHHKTADTNSSSEKAESAVHRSGGNTTAAILAAQRSLDPALRLTSVVLRYVIKRSEGDSVLLSKFIDPAGGQLHRCEGTSGGRSPDAESPSPPGGPSSTSRQLSRANRLCDLLVEFLARVPLDKITASTHHEVTVLLLTLTSTQLRHPAEFDEHHMDVFVESILSSDILKPFFATLLQRVVAWGLGLLPDSQYIYHSGYQPTLKNLYNLFGTVRTDHCASLSEMLGRHSVELLCVLVLHQRGNGVNQAAECFRQLTHGEFVRFEMLLKLFEVKLQVTPCLAGVLYVLLIDHPTFFHSVLTNWPTEFCDVMESLLCLAVATSPLDYATAANGHQPSLSHSRSSGGLMSDIRSFQNIFVQNIVASILCIVSKDATYHRISFAKSLTHSSFVADRYLVGGTVGSLSLAICAKAVARALGDRDEALSKMFLAAIENAAPFAARLDGWASQRIMGLMTTLLRRVHKIELMLEREEALMSAEGDDSHPSMKTFELLAERDSLTLPVQFLSESIAIMLHGRDRGNKGLTYELLYNREHIFPKEVGKAVSSSTSARKSQLETILKPLCDIVANYEAEIASVAMNHSPDDILNLIERVSNSIGPKYLSSSSSDDDEAASGEGMPGSKRSNSKHSGGARKHPTGEAESVHRGRTLMYLYQEAKQCNEFFTAFVWATVLSSDCGLPGSVHWEAALNELPLFYST